MNIAQAISLYAGGQGSGCQGSNCGRKKSGERIYYHVTHKKNVQSILKTGLEPRSTYGGAPGVYMARNPVELIDKDSVLFRIRLKSDVKLTKPETGTVSNYDYKKAVVKILPEDLELLTQEEVRKLDTDNRLDSK